VRKDVESGWIARMPDAIDAIDESSRHHDQCYFNYGWFTRECNVTLVTDLVAIVRSPVSTPQQRVGRSSYGCDLCNGSGQLRSLAASGRATRDGNHRFHAHGI